MPRRPVIVATVAVGLIAACAVLFAWRWNQGGYITLDDGRRVADVPTADTGRYAAPEYAHLRRRYLEAFEWYQKLPMLPIRLSGGRIEANAELGRIVREVTSSEPASKQELARLGAAATDDLTEAVELVFARLAGISLDEYRRRMTEDRLWPGPPRLPLSWDRRPGKSASDDPTAEFAALYAEWNLKYAKLTGVASTPAGWRVIVRRRATVRGGNEFLLRLDPSTADYAHFGGSIGSTATIFHRWPEDWEQFSRSRNEVTQAEMIVIVETISGDRYPVAMIFVFDDETTRWRLTRFSQRVTVRVARTGGLAF